MLAQHHEGTMELLCIEKEETAEKDEMIEREM